MSKYRDLVTSYEEDMGLLRTGVQKFWFGVLVLAMIAAPLVGEAVGGRYVPYLLNLACIAVIVALGLNLLTGTAGLLSLGHAAFLAVGGVAIALSYGISASYWAGAICYIGAFIAYGFAVRTPAANMPA